tara:strand:- start:287 stop:715 length:429 start_codon:yes stop_codon:yes gene_type:complete
MSDQEMNEIYKLMDDENRAAEAIASGVKKNPNFKDRQSAMKIVQKFKLSGERESDVVKGGSSRKVVKGKNIPGGLFKKGGMKTKFDKGGKVINETKIVDIPTPDTSSFVSRRMTLAGPGAAIKKAIGVFPFVGSAFKRGKKG